MRQARSTRRISATMRARRGLVIGPSDGGTDVSVVVERSPEPTPRSQPGTRPAGSEPMGYAHVNRWPLNEQGAVADDTAARLIAEVLQQQAGFMSYALVRTAAHEVVAITIFDSAAHLRNAVEAVAPLVRSHVLPLAAAKPERREGVVLHYRAAA